VITPRRKGWGAEASRAPSLGPAAPPIAPMVATRRRAPAAAAAGGDAAAAPGAPGRYSVILPTYNERENIPIIVWLLVEVFEQQ
jgi:hypothetical protein